MHKSASSIAFPLMHRAHSDVDQNIFVTLDPLQSMKKPEQAMGMYTRRFSNSPVGSSYGKMPRLESVVETGIGGSASIINTGCLLSSAKIAERLVATVILPILPLVA